MRLIDTYKLPITANEEDAADRCSSYINLEELGETASKPYSPLPRLSDRVEAGEFDHERNMADEHLLQEQRFYNRYA